ncbi:MAG TPA: LPS export ABC transporter periplasmic protein LptC [Acidobacteriaceae bacterium]|nr:LPS export ABC transporter periplasmic protein LptC [Acidobacteriaceae bacterium]
MGWTIERLRIAILAIAAFLVVAIFGFLLYSRWRARHLAQDLPAHLGVQIQQSTQGFVLSKTEKGRTIFTLHASRALAFKSGGRVLLHNVHIDVYNEEGQADTIAGRDFQYDRNSQIVESQGEAQIALHTPHNGTAAASGKNAGQVIRVTTHGLVFNQKTGIATCSGEVDFRLATSQGQAIGAEYDSHQGHLLLQSHVVLTTTMQNRPATVHAEQAVYDRDANRVLLQRPHYSSPTQQGSAGVARVFLRGDASAQLLDASGGVQLSSPDGNSINASAMHALLNGSSRPQHVHFIGQVEIAQFQAGQVSSGTAREARLDFDPEGRARRAIFDTNVHFQQQQKTGATKISRNVRSNHLDIFLVPGADGRSELQTAEATGDASFQALSVIPGKAPQQTRVSAQTLRARFLPGNQMDHMEGAVQTEVQTVSINGNMNSSSGDTLNIDFSRDNATGVVGTQSTEISSRAAGVSAESIRYAVQTGHVVMRQSATRGEAAPAPIFGATAMRAEYRSSTDTVELTGGPVFRDPQIELAADDMQVQRSTGKVTAVGAVQGTLRSGTVAGHALHQAAPGGLLSGGDQPVHIIAARAVLLHESQKAIFTGNARLWQGGDTVAAPVIEISQNLQALLGYSDHACNQCVHSTFTGPAPKPTGRVTSMTGDASQQTTSGFAPPEKSRSSFDSNAPQIFRVLSRRLLYSDAERKATFTGHVEVIHADDQLFSDHAELFLSPAAPAASGGTAVSLRSHNEQPSVSRIVATGDVRLVQPSRRAMGARLVYTAADGNFILTGDGKPPQVVDATQGTVTGPTLTFASQEQAIIVGGNAAHPTTTTTRVRKK